MPAAITSRKVKRVLVMLEYEDGSPDNGEVFDLTELAIELAKNHGTHQHAVVELEVTGSNDYDLPPNTQDRVRAKISWKVMQDFKSSASAGYLDDAVNSSLPDSFATEDLRKKLTKARRKIDDLEHQIALQRLHDAAAVRSKHPIARVQQAPDMLPAT